MADNKIRFRCICGRRIAVPAGSEGKKARCPVCQTVLRVPGGPEDESSIIAPASLVKAKILIADDNFEWALSLRAYLRRRALEVLSADTGKEAIQIYKEETPDVVLVRADLPPDGGYVVCEKVKTLARKVAPNEPPIVIVREPDPDTKPPSMDETVAPNLVLYGTPEPRSVYDILQKILVEHGRA